MANAARRPHGLSNLKVLSKSELRALFQRGKCPVVKTFDGPADGLILGAGVLGSLKVWRGKCFDGSKASEGALSGINRIGLGPFEFERYQFSARVGGSLFRPDKVLIIDHDKPSNPGWVRVFHDEVVEVGNRLYLGQSHRRVNGKLVFAGYFALELPASSEATRR